MSIKNVAMSIIMILLCSVLWTTGASADTVTGSVGIDFVFPDDGTSPPGGGGAPGGTGTAGSNGAGRGPGSVSIIKPERANPETPGRLPETGSNRMAAATLAIAGLLLFPPCLCQRRNSASGYTTQAPPNTAEKEDHA